MMGGSPDSPVTVAALVTDALYSARPVVALETTLVTHGFPAIEGLELALELEEIIRAADAVPATIGVLGGRLIVGLTPAELLRLAESDHPVKLNLGNLAAGIASGQPGSTTVAATVVAAQQAGIRVMATGGIGGVHRLASATGDVSADLTALSRCPVAVVCAGAKAILDLPRTLEALETLGVPVLGVGTEAFPAFYRRESGLPLDRGFTSIEELGEAVQIHFDLGVGSGVVVANPVPTEFEMPLEIYQDSLEQALAGFNGSGVHGRDVTPYLLDRLRDLTRGQSSFSNRELLRNNAAVAAKLAAILTR